MLSTTYLCILHKIVNVLRWTACMQITVHQQKSWQTLILFTFLKKGWNQNLSRFMDSQKNFLLRRICILSNTCQVYAVNARIRRSFSIWSLGPESRKKNGRKSTPKYELKFGFFFQDQLLHYRAEWVLILFKRVFQGFRILTSM